MNVHVFLPVVFLICSLALLCSLYWPHYGPVQSRAAAKMHTMLPRLLKPRSPDDCPAWATAQQSSCLLAHLEWWRVLSLCPSTPIATRGAHAASRTRRQTSGATLSTPDGGSGSRQNHPTMDDARGALLPIATRFPLRARKIKCRCSVMSRGNG
jgi:hypothetical protein